MRGYKLDAQTLDDLKAENEKAAEEKTEAEKKAALEGDDNDDADDNEANAGADDDNDGGTDSGGDDDKSGGDDDGKADGESESKEAWMQTDDESGGNDDDKQFTSGDVAAAKRKLKAKVGEQDDEIGQLRKEIDELKSGSVKPVLDTPRPRRAEFENADDPEEAFIYALDDWRAKQSKTVDSRREKAQSDKAAIDKQVDRHYEDASKLVKEHEINPEVYRKADETFRKAIEVVSKGNGDLIADFLISHLGEGSEKTVFNVGLNKSKILLLQEALRSDSTGIKAGMYLATVQAQVTMPKNNGRQAPAPGTQIHGDKPKKGSALARKLLKQRKAAQKEGNAQAAYDVKKEAKKQGVDVSDW